MRYNYNMPNPYKLTAANDDDFLTVKKAAKVLNLPEQVVRNYLYRGVFLHYLYHGTTLLSRMEVLEYKRSRRRA